MIWKVFSTMILIVLLIFVRKYEQDLFYDPFLEYFQKDFRNVAFPDFDGFTMYRDLSIRYLLNTIISIGIIFTWFGKNFSLISLTLLLLLLPILILLYAWFITTEFSLGFTAGFYIRRLIIQPVFLLILIPAFWYVHNSNSTL